MAALFVVSFVVLPLPDLFVFVVPVLLIELPVAVVPVLRSVVPAPLFRLVLVLSCVVVVESFMLPELPEFSVAFVFGLICEFVDVLSVVVLLVAGLVTELFTLLFVESIGVVLLVAFVLLVESAD